MKQQQKQIDDDISEFVKLDKKCPLYPDIFR